MYRVIGSATTRAARVLWMLEELGQAYEHIPEPPQSATALAHNPSGKVPILIVEGANLTDSTAIIQFLADRHGGMTQTAGTIARAQQDGITQKILDEIDSAIWMAARHSFILPEERRLPAIKDSLKWEFDRSQISLSKRLEDRPFLMGSEMTVPDIILSHCLIWARAAKFPPPPSCLAIYLENMTNRPAYRKITSR